jgi:hypothetical protein
MSEFEEVSPGVWQITVPGLTVYHAGSQGSARWMLERLLFAYRGGRKARRK